MSSLNKQLYGTKTGRYTVNAAGTPVPAIDKRSQLIRMTLAHMLWEKQFYVNGKASYDALADLVAVNEPGFVAELAKRARGEFKLRHVPLALLRELARKSKLKATDLADIIQRPDEMSEFLSIYWKDGKHPIPNQVKKGLAQAFSKFGEYQLAKWDKNSAQISLRDVMFLTHPKPANTEQEALFKRIANEQLETPDTWETQLSAGADKKETFERLMSMRKLGALAFLRNLRNMVESGVSDTLIREYAEVVNLDRVLPFRFIAAARAVPQYEDMLERMMFKSLEGAEKLRGKTVLVIDVSGSMFGTKVSAKSDLDRFDAAGALAVLCRELCDNVEIFSFSNDAVRVPPRRGFALVEAIDKSQGHGGTSLGRSLQTIYATAAVSKHDRMIVITDEQSYDTPAAPKCKNGYILNVGSYQNGVNNDSWTIITGFSEAVLAYMMALEKLAD